MKELSKESVRKGLFEDLEVMLRERLSVEPDNLKLHVRLAELYYEASKEEAFLRQAQIIRDLFRGNLDSADWQQIASIGRRIAPDSPIFAADSASMATPETSRRLGESKESRAYFAALNARYQALSVDEQFERELDRALMVVANRPSSLLHIDRFSEHNGGAQIVLKREDLMGPGTALTAAVTGQVLLAKKLGFKEVVTGSVYGQKGIVMASVAASLGLRATVFKDGDETHQQAASVFKMWLCGAEVEILDPNVRNRDVRLAALRHCLAAPEDRFLVMGLESAPSPYPEMTEDHVGVVGREALFQMRLQFKRQPDLMVARGHGSADAFGFFQPAMDKKIRLVCVDPTSELVERVGDPDPATDPFGIGGQNLTDTQRELANAILEGSDYPAVEREHQRLSASGKVEYVQGQVAHAKRTIKDLARLEGLIPAIRTASVIGWAAAEARKMRADQWVVVNVVERSEKDLWDIGKALGMPVGR